MHTLLIDMDDVLGDLLSAWMNLLNSRYNLNVDVTEVIDWNMEIFYPTLTPEQIFSPLEEKELWEEVQPVPGSQKYLKMLHEEGFNIKICTAASPLEFALKTKYFFNQHFSFIDPSDVICVKDKSLIRGDILLDDNYRNLSGGEYEGVLFDKPYNRKYDFKRVESWSQFYDYVHLKFLI